MGTLFRELDQGSVEAEDLYKVLTSEPKVKDSPNAVDFELKSGTINFKKVKFSYNNDQKTLLSNLSLDI